MMPTLVLLLWAVATLGWWAFAFTPLPGEPPAWLAAARHACFGSVESGLPAAHGWMLLILGPASFLVGILVLWGRDVPASLASAVRGRAGAVVAAVLVLAVGVEGAWVLRRVHAARAVGAFMQTIQEDGALPEDYARQTGVAPGLDLVDQHGDRVSLAALRGRPVVLAFVFAHCQTLCPLVVETLRDAADGDGRARVLLVTLDPWRDTPRVLPGIARQWALPEGFHVLSSDRVEDVVDVARRYGVAFTRDERTGDIVHPGLVFLIDADGRLAYTFMNPSRAWVREALRRVRATHVLAG
jgi:cytochrome oxidase Cu insertion factor (SCO1/SenC/PrrC family)